MPSVYLKGNIGTKNSYRSIDHVLETNFNLQIFSLLPKKSDIQC